MTIDGTTSVADTQADDSSTNTATQADPGVAAQATPDAVATTSASKSDTARDPINGSREKLHRVAAMLAAGETPDAIREKLASGKPADTPAVQPGQDDRLSATELGLSEQEFSQLKRSNLHEKMLKMIPPSNRKAIARDILKDAQELSAQKDRAFAAASAAKAGEGKTDSKTTDANAAKAADASTKPDETSPPSVTMRTALDALVKLGTPSAERLRTLADVGGEEYAEQFKTEQSALLNGIKSTVEPMIATIENLAGLVLEQQFESAINQQKTIPGYDKLTPEQVQAIREQAESLMRSNAEIGLRYDRAVPIAANALFSTNIAAATKAQMASNAGKAVRGGIHDTSGADAQKRPISARERNIAIARYMLNNPSATPDEVRSAVMR